ncbi:hypothetical protein DFQ26_006245 [Actinomortierella ambigua]|nr:hypothetical protein DFQ26_006245 [Actinomortierella ambigua]
MHRVIDYSDLPYEVPPVGTTTIGEDNAKLVHVASTADEQFAEFVRSHGDLHPALQIPKTHPGMGSLPKKNQYKNMPLIDRIGKQPLGELILDYALQYYKEYAPDNIDRYRKFALELIQSSTRRSTLEDLQKDKTQPRCIRAIAMHPHLQLMAVAFWNNSVWVYDLSQDNWCSAGLSHQSQTDVSILEWKPMSGVVLAVGCAEGVTLWSVYRTAESTATAGALLSTRVADVDAYTKGAPSQILSESFSLPTRATNHGKESAWMDPLRLPQLPSIDFITWDPLGEQFAAASVVKSVVLIHDMATRRTTALQNGPGPVTTLKWSPAGDRLLVSYLWGSARIYSTITWEYVVLQEGFEGSIQSACWTPDGYNLIYALRDSNELRAAHFERRSAALSWTALNYISMTVPGIDSKSSSRPTNKQATRVSPRTRSQSASLHIHDNTNEENDELSCTIKELALDPVGERLVVRFHETELLAAVIVRPTGRMLRDLDIFQHMGFIRGPGWNPKQKMVHDPVSQSSPWTSTTSTTSSTSAKEPKALTIAFSKHQEKQGTLLAVAMESGKIGDHHSEDAKSRNAAISPWLPEMLRPPTLKEYKDRKLFKYSQNEFYAVVANVEEYHEFIPWCTYSQMSPRKTDHSLPPGTTVQHGELGVGFTSFEERYVSVVTCREPHMVKAVSYNSSLFKELCTIWRFTPNIPKALTTAVASEEETNPEGTGQTRETPIASASPPTPQTTVLSSPPSPFPHQPQHQDIEVPRPTLTAVKVFGPSALPNTTASLMPPPAAQRPMLQEPTTLPPPPSSVSSASCTQESMSVNALEGERKERKEAKEEDTRISSPSNLGTMKPGDYPSCWVDFEIRFEFASPLHASVSSLFFDQVSKEMLKAFVKRCETLYGKR